VAEAEDAPDARARRIAGLDTSLAHPARVYDYWLGGKDNISQVVSAVPHSGATVTIQARKAYYSNIVPLTV
jgi:S-adenosyl methyltransferase